MISGSPHDAYLAARISAFVAAHATERLCPECWRATARRPRGVPQQCDQPGWCAGCGRGIVRGMLVAALVQTGRTMRLRRPRLASPPDLDSRRGGDEVRREPRDNPRRAAAVQRAAWAAVAK